MCPNSEEGEGINEFMTKTCKLLFEKAINKVFSKCHSRAISKTEFSF